jgi:hypothetical protein
MMLKLHLDEDDYPIPVDGRVDMEIKEALSEFVYDIDGMTIRNINIVTED